MIEGKALVRGGSVYIQDLDQTYTKNEIISMNKGSVKMLCSFMIEKELDKIVNYSDQIRVIVNNIHERM